LTGAFQLTLNYVFVTDDTIGLVMFDGGMHA